MPNELVKKIDRQSKLQGSNRSDFIRQAVRVQLTVLEQWQTTSKAARKSYKGKTLNEQNVADTVREVREKASKK